MSDEEFYKMNEQCWRCRMYVPRVEMKYHAGLLYCPICYQDVVEGNRCEVCGNILEHSALRICPSCRERKEAEGERKGEASQAAERKTGESVVQCSECQQQVERVEWESGRPLCPICLEKHRHSLSSKAKRWIKNLFGESE